MTYLAFTVGLFAGACLGVAAMALAQINKTKDRA